MTIICSCPRHPAIAESSNCCVFINTVSYMCRWNSTRSSSPMLRLRPKNALSNFCLLGFLFLLFFFPLDSHERLCEGGFCRNSRCYETRGSSKGCLASEPSWNFGFDSVLLVSRRCVFAHLLISGCAAGSVLSVECSYCVLHLHSFSSGGGRVCLVVVTASVHDCKCP